MRGVQEVAEGAVRGRTERRIEVAAVELHVVDAPLGERARVDLHVELGAGIARARAHAHILVDPKFETECVNLTRNEKRRGDNKILEKRSGYEFISRERDAHVID